MARPDEDAAGRLLEGVGDHAPRGMTVRAVTLDRTRLTGRQYPPHKATAASGSCPTCIITIKVYELIIKERLITKYCVLQTGGGSIFFPPPQSIARSCIL